MTHRKRSKKLKEETVLEVFPKASSRKKSSKPSQNTPQNATGESYSEFPEEDVVDHSEE